MTILFSIHFNTRFGQNIKILGSAQELGGNEPSKAISLNHKGNGIWEKEIRISSAEASITYQYLIYENNACSTYEVGEPRKLGLNNKSKQLILIDQWQGNTPTAPFLTAPFSNVFFSHNNTGISQMHQFTQELIIRATVLNVEKDSAVFICGNHKKLGEWDSEKALKMTPVYGSKWEIHLDTSKIDSDISYKFIIKNLKTGDVQWELTDNRAISHPKIEKDSTLSIEHSSTGFDVQMPKFVGTAIPLFSIRSKNSCGIGDFMDLKPMIDWAGITKQSIIQILPINDTTSTGTWTDSYPYSGISVMALHPIYINIKSVGALSKEATASYNKERKALNSLNEIDYERVWAFKKKYLKILFDLHSVKTFSEPGFQDFYTKNESWLLPYAAFCVLRDQYGSADFSKWGKDSKFSKKLIEKLNLKGSKTYGEISLVLFWQYHLHLQLSQVVEYAHKKGIVLKGDIPIGITPHSVEAWSQPEFFNMDSQAGAPPDDFSANGQNWGFPTYDWDAMSKDNYKWWRDRFSKMSEYFDLYRIDHILGFFRIWEIPLCQTNGLMGYFNPALPYSFTEISNYGFHFDYNRHAKPYIRYYMLREMFGEDCEQVMNQFFNSVEHEVFTFKPEFDTQKKIEEYFKGEESNIKNGLKSLIGEVLFIEDPKIIGKFHPRISAQFTYSYHALSNGEKQCYNILYDEFFYHRHNEFWKEQSLKKLPELVSATNMFTCAEDLGMIPACVPEVLSNLRVATLEIQRMPKDTSVRFANPHYYPYLSVCSTGTHDTSTLRGWWEEDRESTQIYYNTMLGEHGTAPLLCEPWICEKIIKQHINGGSMLTILPLQDWLSIDGNLRAKNPDDERINVPSNPKHYWRYRMHITIEDLIKNQEFNKHLIEVSSR